MAANGKRISEVVNLDCGGVNVSVNTGLFINNEFVPSVESKTFETINPATGKVIANVYEATEADIDVAVDAAEAAFRGPWGKTTADARGRLMMKLYDLIKKNEETLARVEALDNGKPFGLALAVDVADTAEYFSYYAGWATKIHGKTMNIDPATFAFTRREPIGVCGCIIPWNFPLLMAAMKLSPLLAAGNTAVIKSSEKTPLSLLKLAELIREAGFPPGVVNVVSGFGMPAGNAIASHMRIRKIGFTGSTRTGKLIMQAAAKSNLKRVSLELGGKSPNIIFDDCDIDKALASSVPALLFNAGQVCVAGTRVFVQEGIYDEFVRRFCEIAKNNKIGNQFEPGVMQGPQVDKVQFENVMRMIQGGKEQGATVATGGNRHGDTGYFIEPTVFTDTTDDMDIVKNEIFGPVGVVLKFKTEEEVIRRANDTEYGLAAAIFTENASRAIRVSSAIDAGTVWVNGYADLRCYFSFGGYKQSGIGRENNYDAIELYTQVKQVTMKLSSSL